MVPVCASRQMIAIFLAAARVLLLTWAARNGARAVVMLGPRASLLGARPSFVRPHAPLPPLLFRTICAFVYRACRTSLQSTSFRVGTYGHLRTPEFRALSASFHETIGIWNSCTTGISARWPEFMRCPARCPEKSGHQRKRRVTLRSSRPGEAGLCLCFCPCTSPHAHIIGAFLPARVPVSRAPAAPPRAPGAPFTPEPGWANRGCVGMGGFARPAKQERECSCRCLFLAPARGRRPRGGGAQRPPRKRERPARSAWGGSDSGQRAALWSAPAPTTARRRERRPSHGGSRAASTAAKRGAHARAPRASGD